MSGLNRIDGKMIGDGLGIATKAGLDNLTVMAQNIASGSPNGNYPNLAALQAAFPTGNTQNKLVLGNNGGVFEVDTLNVTAAPSVSGNVTVTLNGVATSVAVVIGTAEVASLQVTAPSTVASNVIVTLNGVAINVAVLATDTAIQVADKIRATTFTGWTTGGTVGTDTVIFTATAVGAKTDAIYSAGTTGAAGTMTTTAQGVDADTTASVSTKIRGTAFAGWTTGGSGTSVTFTKSTIGANTAPLFAAGTTGSAGAFTVTTAGEPVRTGDWYYWSGSAWTKGGVYQSTGLADNTIALSNLTSNVKDKLNITGCLVDEKRYDVTTQSIVADVANTIVVSAATNTFYTSVGGSMAATYDSSTGIFTSTTANFRVVFVDSKINKVTFNLNGAPSNAYAELYVVLPDDTFRLVSTLQTPTNGAYSIEHSDPAVYKQVMFYVKNGLSKTISAVVAYAPSDNKVANISLLKTALNLPADAVGSLATTNNKLGKTSTYFDTSVYAVATDGISLNNSSGIGGIVVNPSDGKTFYSYGTYDPTTDTFTSTVANFRIVFVTSNLTKVTFTLKGAPANAYAELYVVLPDDTFRLVSTLQTAADGTYTIEHSDPAAYKQIMFYVKNGTNKQISKVTAYSPSASKTENVNTLKTALKLPDDTAGSLATMNTSLNALDAKMYPYIVLPVKTTTPVTTVTDLSSLTGKTCNFVGDSTTAGGTYPASVATRLGLTAVNCGLSSSTLAINNTYLTNLSIVERVLGLNGNTAYADTDIWTVFGGYNDQFYNSALGDINSTDMATVYGALKAICENILMRPNNPRLLLITPLQSNRNGTYMRDLRIAFFKVAELYSIKVLDLYAVGGINPVNRDRLTSDGLHPNANGTKIFYPKIADAIQSIC